MGRPYHFELAADDPERLADFYRAVFGWQIDRWEGGAEDYWLVTTGDSGPGINGGIGRKRPRFEGTTNTIGVDDVDAAVAAVERNGGSVVMPKTEIPGVGVLAYCADTEGTLFGLMQAISRDAG
jgi:predicted enzyme related to lactoylglutathione lyase